MNRAIVAICAVLAFIGLMEVCKALNENADEIAEALPMLAFIIGISVVIYILYKAKG